MLPATFHVLWFQDNLASIHRYGTMKPDSATFYDSSELRKPLVGELRNLWVYRGLLRLLLARDLTVRYKRSALGVWWTVLNPLLLSGILWLIFGQFFRFPTPGVPYIVYLLSGVLLATFFAQAVVASGSAIVNSASILSKVYVPPEVFSFSSVLAAAVNFVVSLLPLFIVQVATGVGIPLTVLLIPLPVLAMIALVAGLGLLVAAAAVYFYDVLDLTAVLIQMLVYLTPTFYPIAIVPDRFLWIIHANPLYSYLLVFREFAYEGSFAPAWAFAVMAGSALLVMATGVYVFSRSWKRLVVVL
jgi:ABC-type polysaccharide/polyol phosphate export permease